MPRIVACGSRTNAFDSFTTALSLKESFPILLVDSEESPTATPWQHLYQRDRWRRPSGARNDQAQLMVACMETWIMAAPTSLDAFFGSTFHPSHLFPPTDLETRACHDVQVRLEQATRDCGRGKSYVKGKKSFQVLAALNPEELRDLPSFRRFVDTLNRYL